MRRIDLSLAVACAGLTVAPLCAQPKAVIEETKTQHEARMAAVTGVAFRLSILEAGGQPQVNELQLDADY